MSLFHHLFLPHHTNNQRAKILHPISLSVIVGLFAIFQILLGHISNTFPQILGYASQIPPEEIIRLTNIERQKLGLGELTQNSELSAAAAKKATDMFASNYWAHVSPSGRQPWYFITDSGYAYRYAGENLARDFSDPNSVVQAWMNSPSHKENLLNSKYQDIGVAVVDGKLEGRDTTLVVQMFGTKLAAAPAINTTAALTVHAQAIAITSISPTPAAAQTTTHLPTSSSALSAVTMVSPYDITKYASLTLLLVLCAVLVADVIIVNKRKLVRWTGKSFAHLIFIAILLVAATTILRGQIL